MAHSLRFPVLLAGALATAIALAPAATADPRPGCDKGSGCTRPAPVQNQPNRQNPLSTDFTSKDLPKGWTNEAQWARPGASNPFGLGPRPPVLALD